MVCDLAYYFKIEVNTLYKKMLDYQRKEGLNNMNTYGINVPFPSEMTQQDYDDLYSQQIFWKGFNKENYNRQCDVFDEKINLLLSKKEKNSVYKI